MGGGRRQTSTPSSGRVMLQIDAEPGGRKLEKPREQLDVNEAKRLEPFMVRIVK